MKKPRSIQPVLFWLVCMSLTGCSAFSALQSNPSPETLQQTIEAISTQYTPEIASQTPQSSPSPLPTLTSTPVATATPEATGCSELHGQYELREIVLPETSHPLGFRVYLPPCYDTDTRIEYPVLYLLHGQSYNDNQWDRLGADETADRLIQTGEFPPFIMVMPWESNSLESEKISRYDEYLVDNLVPFIDDTYRTCALPECRAIGGISRGGGWAMRIGLMHWDVFGAIGVHSYAPFAGDFYSAPYWFQEIPEDKYPRIYMDFGATDALIEPAGLFEERLTKYSVEHEWVINRGTHTESYWAEHVEDYLYWYTFPWKQMYHGADAGFMTPTPAPSSTSQELTE